MCLSQNLQGHSLSLVESVESVAESCFELVSRSESEPLSFENHSTKSKCSSVECVAKDDLTLWFSTLSTDIKKTSVENYDVLIDWNTNHLERFPQIPHVPQEKLSNPVISSKLNEDSVRLIMDWLRIILGEGHISPSQPVVGKIVGWPTRSISIESLFVDFDLWCRGQGVLYWAVPGKGVLCSIADEVFNRNGNRYDFPPVSDCRGKFAILMGKYESA